VTLRLYFNRCGGKPWSVDAGDGSPEFQFAAVKVGYVGTTVYKPLAIDRNPAEVPCAWIEFENAQLLVTGESAAILIDTRM
jgi:hypothetical protein